MKMNSLRKKINANTKATIGRDTDTKTRIFCPYCNSQHIDRGWFAINPHKRHLCYNCGKNFDVLKVTIGIK